MLFRSGQGDVDPRKLIPNPSNFRKHPLAQQLALSGALDEIGWIQRVIVNKRTGHIVDGHLRVELALSTKEKTVPVCYVDLSEEEERLALATFDPLSAMAITDQKIFDRLLKNISCDNENLRGLLASADLGLNDPDFAPASGDDQGNLDNTLIKHVCPRCGHEF